MMFQQLKCSKCIFPIFSGKILVPFASLIPSVEGRKDDKPLRSKLHNSARSNHSHILMPPRKYKNRHRDLLLPVQRAAPSSEVHRPHMSLYISEYADVATGTFSFHNHLNSLLFIRCYVKCLIMASATSCPDFVTIRVPPPG